MEIPGPGTLDLHLASGRTERYLVQWAEDASLNPDVRFEQHGILVEDALWLHIYPWVQVRRVVFTVDEDQE